MEAGLPAVCRLITLLEHVLTKPTRPSVAISRHSGSLQWKVAPQDKFLEGWTPACAAERSTSCGGARPGYRRAR